TIVVPALNATRGSRVLDWEFCDSQFLQVEYETHFLVTGDVRSTGTWPWATPVGSYVERVAHHLAVRRQLDRSIDPHASPPPFSRDSFAAEAWGLLGGAEARRPRGR